MMKESTLRFNIIISKDLEEKIRFMCMQLPANEWSGTLFYTTKGTIENNDFEITATDFYLQDIGVSTFTEFQNDASLANYIVEHDLLDNYQALIHSHNSMGTFFSSTDMDTLKEEGNDRNHFLSLIVNNAGIYNAKFTRKITVSEHKNLTKKYNTYGNVSVELPADEVEASYDVIEYFNLNVIIEQPNDTQQELKQRIVSLKADSKSYINAREIKVPQQQNKTYPAWVKTEYENTSTVKTDNPKTKTDVPFAKNNHSQLTLFSDEEMENGYNVEGEKYSDIHCDANIIRNNIIQLVTGNIFSMWNKSIDLNSWAANMLKLYDKRFPEFEDFEYWADMMISFLENDFKDDTLSEIPRKYQIGIWAEDLMDAIVENLPTNRYTNAFLEILEAYLV